MAAVKGGRMLSRSLIDFRAIFAWRYAFYLHWFVRHEMSRLVDENLQQIRACMNLGGHEHLLWRPTLLSCARGSQLPFYRLVYFFLRLLSKRQRDVAFRFRDRGEHRFYEWDGHWNIR